jgi:lipid A 3-O-deacylase
MRLLVAGVTAALLLPSSASATELFGGVYAHAVKTPLSLDSDREDGVDLSVGVRGGRIGGTPLQPHLLAMVNTNGGTNFLAAGLSAKFGNRVYVRPGLGIAIHDGSSSNYELPDRLAFGSRVLFEPEIAVGATVNPRLSVEASWVHFSHAQIFGRQNPGIDNIGVRLNWRL